MAPLPWCRSMTFNHPARGRHVLPPASRATSSSSNLQGPDWKSAPAPPVVLPRRARLSSAMRKYKAPSCPGEPGPLGSKKIPSRPRPSDAQGIGGVFAVTHHTVSYPTRLPAGGRSVKGPRTPPEHIPPSFRGRREIALTRSAGSGRQVIRLTKSLKSLA